ncbi:MAG: hypothetical protein R6W75_09320 [Smithellaceae bacterium]
MENKEIAKQMMDYQKAAIETGFNSMLMLQEQTSKAVDTVMKQSPWIPAQAKSLVDEWSSIYKKSTLDMKDAIEQNYSKMEEFFTSGIQTPKNKNKN